VDKKGNKDDDEGKLSEMEEEGTNGFKFVMCVEGIREDFGDKTVVKELFGRSEVKDDKGLSSKPPICVTIW
jgi:hypothetical protein